MTLARVAAILFALAVLAWLVIGAQQNGQRKAAQGQPDADSTADSTANAPGPVPATYLPSSKVMVLPSSTPQQPEAFLFSSKSGMPLPAIAEPVPPAGRK